MDLISKHIPLDKEDSIRRKNLLSEIKYFLFLNFSTIKLNHYEGYIKIEINLKEISDIFLDFEGITSDIIINDKPALFHTELNRIYIYKKSLKIGLNKFEIKFTSSLIDKTTSELKMFSNGNANNKIINEPFSTHRIFPCFDQPNLKCDINLYTYGNKDITFISNSSQKKNFNLEKEIFFKYREEPDCKISNFEEMKEISTHQFCLFGGNFYRMSDPLYDKKQPELHLYFKKCRKIDNKPIETFFNIFSILREGVDWFERKLNLAFPYKKLEVVFVPDYKSVANSYPGGVVFIDVKFLKENSDMIQTEYFKFLLINQISQMWLSHFYSINWWDNSFLLESLNIFTTHLFFKERLSKQDSNEIAELIFDNFKTKAIVADKSPGSHPVWTEINDTNDARILCDEITCYKGASLFNYFYYLVGEQFWRSLEDFLHSSIDNERLLSCDGFFKYFENINHTKNISTSLNLDYIQTESSTDQFKFFLKNSKMSRLRCIPQTKGNFESIAIVQETADILARINHNNQYEETYYPYTIDILFIYSDRHEIIDRVKILPKQINIIKLEKIYSNPLAIILNYTDTAHIIQRFDQITVNSFIENPQTISNNQTKLLIIRDLYEMIKDGDCEPLLYIKLCRSLLELETNIYVANRIISNMCSVIHNYLAPVAFRTQKNEMFKLLTESYYHKDLFQGIKRTLINYILDMINTSSLDNIKFFLTHDLGISIDEVQEDSEVNELREYDIKFLDLKTRKRIVSAIYQNDMMPSFDKEILKRILLNEENEQTDKYEEIRWSTYAIETSDKDKREGLWKLLVYNDRNLTEKELAAYIKGFNKQAKLFAPEIQKYYRKRFFLDFPYVFTEHSLDSAIRFYKYLNPCFETRLKILNRMVKLKAKLKFTEENLKLKMMMESDIEELKKKLLLEKIYSQLKLHKQDNRFDIYY